MQNDPILAEVLEVEHRLNTRRRKITQQRGPKAAWRNPFRLAGPGRSLDRVGAPARPPRAPRARGAGRPARRAGSSSSTSSCDPGDDGEPEPGHGAEGWAS